MNTPFLGVYSLVGPHRYAWDANWTTSDCWPMQGYRKNYNYTLGASNAGDKLSNRVKYSKC